MHRLLAVSVDGMRRFYWSHHPRQAANSHLKPIACLLALEGVLY